MRLFISAGEPSGDLHGANLIHALRRLNPGVECDGFGGERMADAGCNLAFPLCDLALVGLFKVLANVPRFARVLGLAERCFRERRPDAVVLIDFPGFHWWLARRARALGIPVIYFIPPQLWAWGGWRIRKMRRLVDRVLCVLPFEADWYQAHGVPSQLVGHPYFDELGQQRLAPDFMARQQAQPGTVITLLPGSRNQELHFNLEPLLRAAGRIHARRPETRFLAACFKEKHRLEVEAHPAARGLPLEAHAGRTPECIELAHSCLSVSGSVGLELLWRGKPSVVVYHHHWFGIGLAHLLKQCRYVSLVNLLADKPLFPEYVSVGSRAEAMADDVVHWLENPSGHETLRAELAALRRRVAVAGACERAAGAILHFVSEFNTLRAA
jgi:lipid-A-disaccharide synthase